MHCSTCSFSLIKGAVIHSMKSKRRLWSDLSIKEAQNLRSCCCLLVCWPYKIVRGMVYQEPQEYQTECKTRTKLYDTNENIPCLLIYYFFMKKVLQIDFHIFESFLKYQLSIEVRIMYWSVQVPVVHIFPNSWFICEYCPLGTLLVSQLISHIWFLHPPIGAHQICFAYVVIVVISKQPFP